MSLPSIPFIRYWDAKIKRMVNVSMREASQEQKEKGWVVDTEEKAKWCRE